MRSFLAAYSLGGRGSGSGFGQLERIFDPLDIGGGPVEPTGEAGILAEQAGDLAFQKAEPFLGFAHIGFDIREVGADRAEKLEHDDFRLGHEDP